MSNFAEKSATGMKSFEYKEIVDLRDKIPTSGSPVLYGYPSITTCGIECSKTDSCQMFFHKSDWQACILYEFFVWNSNFGVASNGFRAFKMKTVGKFNLLFIYLASRGALFVRNWNRCMNYTLQ